MMANVVYDHTHVMAHASHTHQVVKPWGIYKVLARGARYWIKELRIKKGERFSLQSHAYREETWIVQKGIINAIVGARSHIARAGSIIHIKKKQKHRMIGVTPAVVLEISLGTPRERDIIRYQDDYGRIIQKRK